MNLRLHRRIWEHLNTYLPLIVMGLLALGSYWLLRSTPDVGQTQQQRVAKHEPDYRMEQFSLRSYADAGRLRSEIFGREAKHFPDTETLEVEQVRVRAFDAKGNQISARADRAIVNSDGSEVQLLGRVTVERQHQGAAQQPMSLRSEFLHAYLDTGQLKSHKPVQMQHGDNKFTADGLEIDEVEQVMTLRGRVRGQIRPGPAR